MNFLINTDEHFKIEQFSDTRTHISAGSNFEQDTFQGIYHPTAREEPSSHTLRRGK